MSLFLNPSKLFGFDCKQTLLYVGLATWEHYKILYCLTKKVLFEQLLFCGWANEQVYLRFLVKVEYTRFSLFVFCGRIKHFYRSNKYMLYSIYYKCLNKDFYDIHVTTFYTLIIILNQISEPFITAKGFSPVNNAEKPSNEVQRCQLIYWFILTRGLIRANIAGKGFIKSQIWKNIPTFIRVSHFACSS